MTPSEVGQVEYLMRVFGLSRAAAIDTIDLLTNGGRIEELRSGLIATIDRIVAMTDD